MAERKIKLIPLVYGGGGKERGRDRRASFNEGSTSSKHVPSRPDPVRPLRVLFLGNICLRKGIGRLIDAMAMLRDVAVELHLVGRLSVDPRLWAELPAVTWHGVHPHESLEKQFEAADVFILPTLSDGYALTQLEAICSGLPVIASRRCGRIVEDGVNGFLLQENSAAEIAAVLKNLEAHRELLDGLLIQGSQRTIIDLQGDLLDL